MFTMVDEIRQNKRAIALLFRTRSALVGRNEGLIQQALAGLVDEGAKLLLLDETDPAVLEFVADSFPGRYDAERDGGRGAMIWVRDGVPVLFLHGGPYRVPVEILQSSRTAWAERVDESSTDAHSGSPRPDMRDRTKPADGAERASPRDTSD